MEGQDPQSHEVWAFSDDGVTRESHPAVQVEVGAEFMGEFSSNYLIKNKRRIPIIGRILINGSVEWLGVPDFHRTGGTFWDHNLLDLCSSWGYSDTTTNQNWGSQPGGPYGSDSVLWSCPVRVMPAYVRRSTENTRATARHIHENHP